MKTMKSKDSTPDSLDDQRSGSRKDSRTKLGEIVRKARWAATSRARIVLFIVADYYLTVHSQSISKHSINQPESYFYFASYSDIWMQKQSCFVYRSLIYLSFISGSYNFSLLIKLMYEFFHKYWRAERLPRLFHFIKLLNNLWSIFLR